MTEDSERGRSDADVDASGILSRRSFLGAAALAVGGGLGYVAGDLRGDGERSPVPAENAEAISFFGDHQAGIGTPAPEFLNFAAFDLVSGSADDLRGLLREWASVASTVSLGRSYRVKAERAGAPPSDPGEAVGLGPAALTVTFGFGPGLFSRGGVDGLGSRWPAALAALPPFKGDSLDPTRSGGDLCVQVCADDPQAAFHAIHVMARIAIGVASLRWVQHGFGPTAGEGGQTPRNLMGFKDGTNNVRGDDAEAMDEHVWVQPGDGPEWMEGGTYMVVRRIKMLLDVWDETSLGGQERVIGREKQSGAPLGGREEHDEVDLDAREEGQPVIPSDAHVRLSSPESNGGARLLRRGYSFSEPPEPGSGQLEVGLFFICFQRDPRRQFVPIQRRLAASDALNRHILHTGSAVFACPPGVEPGGFVGEGLFA